MSICKENIDLNEFNAFAVAEQERDSLLSEDPDRFSARITSVPRSYHERFPSYEKTALYKDYLQCKYAYFSYCISVNAIQEIDDEFLSSIEDLKSYWKDDVRTNEACVYLLRRNQFGENALEEWYSQELDEFTTWINLITTNAFLSEHEDSDDIEKHKFSVADLSLVQKIEKEVSKKFIELIEANKSDESEYLFSFLRILQSKSGAKVCDFLYIDFKNKEVDFKLASIELTPEDIASLIQEESYHERIGITGSILVPCSREYLHVGTNNLSKDPRQAEKQNAKYAKIYKLDDGVKSFWVFPIRDFKHNIVAAFRVVDKKNGSVWSYSERFSLLAVAEWFSFFWEYTRSVLSTLNTDDVRKVTYKCCTDDCTECLGGIGKETLHNILEHLRSVAHRKVESHGIGASILIVPNARTIENAYAVFPKYPISFDITKSVLDRPLEYLSLSYKGINPKTAMFVYDKDLEFLGVYMIRNDTDNFEKGILDIGDNLSTSVLFTLIGNTNTIRIFAKGKMVADYYHSEAEGLWRFRCIKEIKQKCKEMIDDKFIAETIFDKILSIALELSFDKKGAMIVICDDETLDVKLRDGKRAIGELEQGSLTNNNIRDYATMDGAIVLTTEGVVREIGTILPVDEITSENIHKSKYQEWNTWKSQLAKKQKGSRHTTAIKFSLQHPDACIFVVSENRGISIFYKEKALLWDDETFPIH